MLQFFKKSGQKSKDISDTLKTKFLDQEKTRDVHTEIFNPTKNISFCNLSEEEEEKICSRKISDMRIFRSRLSKSLSEIIADKSALGYFIQYMDSKNHVALIKFWLEVECLCGAAYNQNNDLSQTKNYLKTSMCNIDDSELVSSNGYNCDGIVEVNDNDMPKNSDSSSQILMIKDEYLSNTKQDIMRIYKKYIASDILGSNTVSSELMLDIKNMIEHSNIELLLKSLSIVQKNVYKVIEEEYVNDFLRSSFNCKHQIDVLTSGDVKLADILYDETAFFYFIEFMEQENKRELLDFWMSAINFKHNFLDKNKPIDPCETQSDALIIYEKYFSLQATKPLGMSNKIRFAIEQNICREDGRGPQSDCFDKACKLVYHQFVTYYLPAFLSSQLYYKYLSELISTIQNNMCSKMKPNLKRTDSDCSSEISLLSIPSSLIHKNESDKKKLKGIASCSGSMNIDMKQLYDPDSLWKRNKKSLSVGYIDNMGRFVTEIEPEPRRKRDNESRLTRAVKRLVHLEQDETKEELAWKIAEMIIGDITSQTLGSSHVPS